MHDSDYNLKNNLDINLIYHPIKSCTIHDVISQHQDSPDPDKSCKVKKASTQDSKTHINSNLRIQIRGCVSELLT
jgi:hypothetical protein